MLRVPTTVFFNETDSRIISKWKKLVDSEEDLSEDIKKNAAEVFKKAVLSNRWDEIAFMLSQSKEVELGLDKQTGVDALIAAATHDQYDILTLLLEEGVDVNGTNKNNQTAIDEAFRWDHWHILELLLGVTKQNFNYVKDKPGHHFSCEKILLKVASKGLWDIVDILINQKAADLNKKELIGEGYFSFLRYIARYSPEKLDGFLKNPNLEITVEGAEGWLRNFLSEKISKGGDEGRLFAIEVLKKCDDQVKQKYLVEVQDNFALYGTKQQIESCAELYGGNFSSPLRVISLINQKKIERPLEVFKYFVEKIPISESVLSDLQYVPSYSYMEDESTKAYMKKVAQIVGLHRACWEYRDSLFLKSKVNERKIKKDNNQVKEKIKCVEELMKTLNYIDVEKSYAAFQEKFKTKDTQSKLNTFKDKKFKRIVLAIITGGIYALVRKSKRGSPRFWESRREILFDRVNAQMEEKISKKRIKK